MWSQTGAEGRENMPAQVVLGLLHKNPNLSYFHNKKWNLAKLGVI